MSEVQNDQLLLISGTSASGKSSALRNIRNPNKWFYLNCENKRLPFKSKFQEYRITDPYQIHEGLDAAAKGEEWVKTLQKIPQVASAYAVAWTQIKNKNSHNSNVIEGKQKKKKIKLN